MVWVQSFSPRVAVVLTCSQECVYTDILHQQQQKNRTCHIWNASSCIAVKKTPPQKTHWNPKISCQSVICWRFKCHQPLHCIDKGQGPPPGFPVIQNRNQRSFHNTDEHNTYYDTQRPTSPLNWWQQASKRRSDDNKWWQSKRSSSFDEARDKAQTPSQRLITNDETVFSASFGVIFKKTSQMAGPFDQHKQKKPPSLMLFILFVVGLCHIELWQ